jgi:predicted dehydrogenase/threonine dehydrogenase-like Zn-dependent dehydrogenase
LIEGIFLKQVIQSYKNGKISMAEVPEPACKAGGVLVQTRASLISVGTEKLMIEMGKKSLLGKARARPDLVRQAWAKAQKEGFVSVFKEAMHRLDEPVPLGYSAAGVVQEVGAGVAGFKPGDRVAVMGAGFASHAEVVWVPDNLCAAIPPDVDFEAAAFGMLGCIALHGVREAGLTLGEKAVVIGLGLLGLLTVQFLTAQGCRVMGVDLDRQKCDLALTLGADLAVVPGEDNVEEAVANFTDGVGADAVLIVSASKDNRPLMLAEAVARERARLVLVGVADLSLTRKTFWTKELRFSVSKAAGPGSIEPLYEGKGFDYPLHYVRWTEGRNLAACLDLMAQGKLRVAPLITHRFPIEEALAAYDLILGNKAPYIGVLLTYPEKETAPARSSDAQKVWLKPAASSPPSAATVGLIGGGKFTKNILMPILHKSQGVQLAGVATTSGVSSRHLAQKYGFSYATTDYREILKDEGISRVIITTPHNLHGRQVVEALRAGKHVFVEKPLCLTAEELNAIEGAFDGSRMLMVGFNRRFAPLTREIKKMLAGRTTPLVMTYRVNAGYIPEGSWVHDPEVGGGRLLGEVCHFIDFLQFMAEAEPVVVQAASISGDTGKYRRDDNLVITLTFADGSVGSIIYTAKGSKAFSRERFEVYGEETVGVIEDFRRGQIVRGGASRNIKKLSMDMGYTGELAAFVKPESDRPDYHLQLFRGFVMSTRASIKTLESLITGKVVHV